MELSIGEIEFYLFHAPGETNDHTNIKIDNFIIPGDNIYPGFPNLYAIRGTETRDANAWSESEWNFMQYTV